MLARVCIGQCSSFLAAGIFAVVLVGTMQAVSGTECKPHHFHAPFFIKSMGPCNFDLETLSYAGTPVQQAMCLMRRHGREQEFRPSPR